MNQHFAIIGGGITGLAAALRLEQKAPQSHVTLVESADRLGGVLQTRLKNGYLIEHSADMFTTELGIMPALCRDLGLENELIPTNTVGRRAFVAKGHRLHPVPNGFSMMLPHRMDSILDSELLDPAGRLRLLAERWVPRSDGESDESLESFAVRRFGQQAFEQLIQPLISGIYSADPKKLSMRAALGRFVSMERDHGSLILAAKAMKQPTSLEAGSSGARYGIFLALKNGMQSLIDRMAESLKRTRIVYNTQVKSVLPIAEGRWQIQAANTGWPDLEPIDGLILAARADVAGKLLSSLNTGLSRQLSAIENASMAIVIMAVDASQIPQAPECFGFVVPEVEGRNLVACSFASNKFPGRAPQGKVLLRCFIGGSLHAERVKLDDEELFAMARQDLAELIGFRGEPEFQQVIRWSECMPQYHVGHLEGKTAIEQQMAGLAGIELAGNSYGGVGIPVCVASGQRAADRLIDGATKS